MSNQDWIVSDISGWPVMSASCATCPFKDRGDGRYRDERLAAEVITRNMLGQTEQVCHHPRLEGKEETHLCAGYRGWKNQIAERTAALRWVEGEGENG